jgi:hypothetical protein
MRLDALPPLGAGFSKVTHPLYPGLDFLDCRVICRCSQAANVKFTYADGNAPENAPRKCLRILESEIGGCDFEPIAAAHPA